MIEKCQGCSSCDEGTIPDFDSDEAEDLFWQRHTIDQLKPAPVRLKLRGRPVQPVKRERITMMLHPRLKENLEQLAAQSGIGYQTLMQQYLEDRVTAELAKRSSEPATTAAKKFDWDSASPLERAQWLSVQLPKMVEERFSNLGGISWLLLFKHGLKSLRHYLESPDETEISWDCPAVELHYPAPYDWENDTPVEVTTELYKDVAFLPKNKVAERLAMIVHDIGTLTVLSTLTNHVGYRKCQDELIPIVRHDVHERLTGLSADDQQREIERLFAPYQLGTPLRGYHSQVYERSPFVLTWSDDEAQQRSGVIEISIAFEPLVVDEALKESYYPITIGLLAQQGPRLSELSEQQRFQMWDALFAQLERLADELQNNDNESSDRTAPLATTQEATREDTTVSALTRAVLGLTSAWPPRNRSPKTAGISHFRGWVLPIQAPPKHEGRRSRRVSQREQ